MATVALLLDQLSYIALWLKRLILYQLRKLRLCSCARSQRKYEKHITIRLQVDASITDKLPTTA